MCLSERVTGILREKTIEGIILIIGNILGAINSTHTHTHNRSHDMITGSRDKLYTNSLSQPNWFSVVHKNPIPSGLLNLYVTHVEIVSDNNH